MMEAVILAGGAGKRLQPLTEHRPKPLIPVAGKPCIDYVIKSLVSADFKKIIITTGHLSDKVIKGIADGGQFGAHILYSFEEVPVGTAGAVKRAEGFLTGTFVVASGDVLADVNIKELLDFHRKSGALATMALTEVKDPTDFGIVGMDKGGRINRFLEKPKKEEAFSNLINAGIYVLEPEVLSYIPADTLFDFAKNLFPILLEKGLPLYGKTIHGIWRDIGRPSDLLRASLDVIERSGSAISLPGVKTSGPIILGKNAVIEKGVRIVGPAYIGDDAFLSRGCVIERSCIYKKVFVDKGTVIRDSIVLDGSHISWQSEVDSSVVSQGCNIEEDVRIVRSVIGDNMAVKIHSRLEDANISPPNGEPQK
ncbi:MAG: NDP-sugar synthase [Methanobacteriota archaeon]